MKGKEKDNKPSPIPTQPLHDPISSKKKKTLQKRTR
jgi:hypothetical protein